MRFNMFCKFFFIIIFSLLLCTANLYGKTHTVVPGDTLSKIAKQYYSDPSKWPTIWRANKELIKDIDKVKPGWVLLIPSLDAPTPPEDPLVVHLVTGDGFQPYSDKKSPEDGLLTEMVLRVFKEMGKKVKLEFGAWNHGCNATLQGEFMGTFPYYMNDHRTKIFNFSEALFTVKIYGYVKKNSTIQYNEDRDLQGLTVCHPEGYEFSHLQKFLDAGIITLKRSKDMSDCFKMVENGEADLVTADGYESMGTMAKLFGKKDQLRRLDKAFNETTMHLIIPKKRPRAGIEFPGTCEQFDEQQVNLMQSNTGRALILDFNEQYNKLRRNGIIKEMVKRHMNYYMDYLSKPNSNQ